MNKVRRIVAHVITTALVLGLAWLAITWFKLTGPVADGLVVLVIGAVEKTIREVTGFDWVRNA